MIANPVTGRKASSAAKRGAMDLKPRAHRINDACAILQIGRSHLYALAAKGQLRLVRLGSRTLVPRE